MILQRLKELMQELAGKNLAPEIHALFNEITVLVALLGISMENSHPDVVAAKLRRAKDRKRKETKEKMASSEVQNSVEFRGMNDIESKSPRVLEPMTQSPRAYDSFNAREKKSGTNPRELGTNPRNQTDAMLAKMTAFEQFWLIYPRRQGKGGARKSFLNALKRATIEEVLAGARRYAASKREKQYTAMPQTWLNQDRWLDELDEPKQPVSNAPRWIDVKYDYEQKYGKKDALARYSEDLGHLAGAKPGATVIRFPVPAVSIRQELPAPVEGEDLDALVRRDDEGPQGGPCQNEPRGSGLLDILPALQAMDQAKED